MFKLAWCSEILNKPWIVSSQIEFNYREYYSLFYEHCPVPWKINASPQKYLLYATLLVVTWRQDLALQFFMSQKFTGSTVIIKKILLREGHGCRRYLIKPVRPHSEICATWDRLKKMDVYNQRNGEAMSQKNCINKNDRK